MLILDANDDVHSKKALFKAAWDGRYKGYVEYRPNSELVDVDVADADREARVRRRQGRRAERLPPQRAGAIARQLGMANANERWCEVDWLTYESTAQKASTCSATRSRSRR